MGLQRMPLQRFGGINVVDAPYDLESHEASDTLNVRPTSVETQEGIEARGGALVLETPDDANATPVEGVFNSHRTVSGFSVLTDGKGAAYSCYERDVDSINAGKMTRRYLPSSYTGTWEMCSLDIGQNDGTDFVLMVPKRMAVIDSGGTLHFGGVTPRAYWARDHSLTSFSGDSNTNTRLATTRSLAVWRNRIFSIYAWTHLQTQKQAFSKIHYSDPGDIQAWGSNQLRIIDATSSLDCKLVVHRNNLYLLKERSLWMIYDPNTLFNRLIAEEGMGDISNADAALSCPYDQRLYWFNSVTGDLWSSNGETDLILENERYPIREGFAGFDSLQQSRLIKSQITDDSNNRHRLGPCRMVYDPQKRSILLFFPGNDTETFVLELHLRGKPGDHPIYIHKYSTPYVTHADTMGRLTSDQNQGTEGTTPPTTPEVFHSQPIIEDRKRVLFWSFGDSSGRDYFDGIGGTLTKSVPNARWTSGWRAMASEEPVERIRRINIVYRGKPGIKYFTSDSPSFTPTPKLWIHNFLEFVSGTDRDREYKSLKGPNFKGRYHMFQIYSDLALASTERWRVSVLEFVLRGGKQKR